MSVSNWKKSLAVVASVGSLGLLLAGCGGTAGTNTAGTTGAATGSQEGGSIMLDSISNVKDLDPAKAYDTTSNEFVEQMYDTLVTYQGATSNIIPNAATSWEVSPDGKTYTFHLRTDMKFWNGDAVTAQSYVDEFQRVLSKTVNSPGESFLDPIVAGSTAYFQGKATSVSGLSAPDKNTLVVKLTQPEPFFLEVLAMPFFAGVDSSYIKQVGGAAFDAKSPMGSGAFKLDSISPNQVVLKKNPNYWMKDKSGNQLPYLDQVTVRFNSNNNLDAMNFQKGETAFLANLTRGVPSSSWPQFQADPKLKALLNNQPQNATYYLGLNNTMKPFDNPSVRQAVEYAIDKQKIQKLLNGRMMIANQPLPPGIKGYVNQLPADASYTYDVSKAKQLLAKAGFPNGFSTTLYTQNDAQQMKLVNSIQNDLAQVGIKATINASSWATFLNSNEKGNVQPMFMLAWMQDFPDASDFLNTLFNSSEQPQNNSSMYSNKQVDTWLNQAQTDTNESDRYSLYNKVTEQVMKDAPWVPLYYGENNYAIQSWVHGFVINPTLMDPLQFIWVDKNH